MEKGQTSQGPATEHSGRGGRGIAGADRPMQRARKLQEIVGGAGQLSRAVLCGVLPCLALPFCAVLCCAVLCCAVPCRAVPCRAVPCRAVPCCAVLCCARSSPPFELHNFKASLDAVSLCMLEVLTEPTPSFLGVLSRL